MEIIKTKGLRAILAGMLIGISAVVYLSVDNKIAGTFLFSFGLLTIVVQGFCLYTGMIGYVTKPNELLTMAVVIAGNFIGTYLVALFAKLSQFGIDSSELCQKKLALPPEAVLVRSILCGILMFLAVDGFRKKDHAVYIVLPIMIFILSGFEHSVANMFYFSLAGAWNLKALGYMLIMIIGNGIGAYALHRLRDLF